MTIFSEPVSDIAGANDTTTFVFYREEPISENAAGDGIVSSTRVHVRPVDGVLTTPPLEPGPAKVSWNGKKYDVVIPDSATPVRLWPEIVNYIAPPAPVVNAAVAAKIAAEEAADRAEAVEAVQNSAIAGVVGTGPTKAALDATYAPRPATFVEQGLLQSGALESDVPTWTTTNAAVASALGWVIVAGPGIDPTGTTDSTAAIQAKLTGSPGKQRWVPAGTYLVTGLTISQSLGIHGAGAKQTVFKLANGANANVFSIAAGNIPVDFDNISVNGNKANNTSGNGIEYLAGPDSTYRTSGKIVACWVTQCKGHGIAAGMSRNLGRVSFTDISNCDGDAVHLDRSVDWYVTSCDIGFSGRGVYLSAGGAMIANCGIYGNTNNFYIDTGGGSVNVTGCVIDGSVNSSIYINGTFDPREYSFIGCSFNNTGTGGTNTYNLIQCDSANAIINFVGNRVHSGAGESVPKYLFNISATTKVNYSSNAVKAGAVGTAISNRMANVFGIPRGRVSTPKPPTGSTYVGVPGAQFNNAGTRSMTAGQIRYYPFEVVEPITLSALQAEVTTAPAADGHLRMGIYAATTDWQPTGAPLVDLEVAVTTATTGVVSAASTVVLAPGLYLMATNVDQAMTVRSMRGGISFLLPAMGGSPIAEFLYQTSAYAALPSTPVAWAAAAGAQGPSHAVMLQWTSPDPVA